jgi:hypothetical protein
MDPERGVKEQIGARVSVTTSGVTGNTCNRPGSGGPALAGSQSPGSGQLFRASGGIIALALTSEDIKAVACALDALRPLLPLDPYQEAALEKRMLALVARGAAAESPDLSRAIAHILYVRARQRARAVVPFVPTLLSFLDEDLATTGANSYYTLMILAEDAPDDLFPFADRLIGKLDSSGYAVKTLIVRVLAALGRKRPGYLVNARGPLRDLAEGSEDGILKAEAMKALQAIEWPIMSPVADRAIAGRTATSASSRRPAGRTVTRAISRLPARRTVTSASPGKPAGHKCLLTILAQLMNLWRVISRSHSKGKEISRIADDLREITRWIEAEFPASGDGSRVKNALILPAERPHFFTPKIKTEMVLPKMMLLHLARPGRRVAVVQPSLKVAAPVNERAPGSEPPANETETARPREIMAEIGGDFSVKASRILDAPGMEHMKPAGTDGSGDRSISASEFRLALETIVHEKKSNGPVTSPAPLCSSPRSSWPEMKRLLGEINRHIDDSLQLPSKPATSTAENILKPSQEEDRAGVRSPSRVGHPPNRKASFTIQHTKRDGRVYKYYDRDT